MEFREVIEKRTATRKFKDEKVDEKIIEKILSAGRLAPTAKNLQPQIIYVVKSKEGIEKIDKASPCRYNAPVVLIVCSDKKVAWSNEKDSSYEMDASIVATHLMLAATDLGVDNIWIKMFDKEIIKQEFNLRDGVEPVCLIPLGYKVEGYVNPMHTVRKELSQTTRYV